MWQKGIISKGGRALLKSVRWSLLAVFWQWKVVYLKDPKYNNA